MTTLAAGSSVTFGLSVDQTFELTTTDGTTGTISLNGPFGSPMQWRFGPARQNNWKPVSKGLSGALTLTCTAGRVSYELGNSVFVTATTDAVTGLQTGLLGASGSRLRSFLERVWQDLQVPLATGCTVRPVYRTYIDAVNGDDSWDGTVPVWTSGTTGPKRTAVVANWTGSKTSWFGDEILLFAAGQTHTLTATGASIGLTTRKHLGAYWVPSAPNAVKPIIKSRNNVGSAGGLDRACISASGTLQDISVSDLTIDTSDVPNRFGISLYQTAAGQSINNITFRNVSVIGGAITDSVGYGGIAITYYGQSATLAPYPASANILYDNCDVTGYPGHGFVNSGTLGVVRYQVDGKSTLTAFANLTDRETIVIAGITFTSVEAIGATAGNFLIGASTAATLANLAGIINAPSVTSATQVALSAANQAALLSLGAKATVSVAGDALVLTFTAWDAAAYVSETQTNAYWSNPLVQTFARWGGVDLINCVANGCGAGWDTHGFTGYSGGVLLDQTSAGWTNTTSTIYWVDIDGKYGRDIPDVEIMYMDTGSGTEVFKLLKNTTTPTTPAVGEFGFDKSGGTGALRLYANFGAAITVANRFSIAVRPTKGVRYIRCAAINQTVAGRSGTTEGHGFAFDDFSSDCSIVECVSINNAGHGVTINRGDNNQIVATHIAGNALAAIKGNFGWGQYIGKCYASGAGMSDTAAPNKGFIHLAHASHKAYGPNGTYAGTLPAADTYGSVIANSTLKYAGADTAVGLVLGPTSNNAPPVVCFESEMDPGVGVLTLGRAIVQGRATGFVGLPDHVKGVG